MKKLFTSLLLLTLYSSSFGQSTIANGAICPNITIIDTKGVAHKLYDYCAAGKYVLIDFYAYWCGPCKITAPKIDQFYKKYGCNTGNVIVLGNESDPAGTLANLHSFDAAAGLDTSNSYPTTYGIIGGEANGATYGVNAYPTIVLIGPNKKMINNDVWPVSTIADIENKFPTGILSPKACAAPASTSSIEENTISFSLSPNPANDMITVSSNNITDIILFNQVGSKVLSFQGLKEIQTKTIDLSSLSQGIYIVEVTTKKGKATNKFTKD